MSKILCKICNKNMAVWIYMPKNYFYCDNCVPRGCSCNLYTVKDDGKPDNSENFM